ncbi:MAG: hypothetical protein WCE97_10055, partial [Candidatus Cybelea sp.]
MSKIPNNFRGPKHTTRNPFGARCAVAVALGVTVLAGPGGCARRSQAPPSTVRFDLAADPQNLNPLFLT